MLLDRFRDELFGEPMLEMKNLRQESSFSDYQGEFEGLLYMVSHVRFRSVLPSTNLSEGWNSTYKVRFNCSVSRHSWIIYF